MVSDEKCLMMSQKTSPANRLVGTLHSGAGCGLQLSVIAHCLHVRATANEGRFTVLQQLSIDNKYTLATINANPFHTKNHILSRRNVPLHSLFINRFLLLHTFY